MPLDHMDALDPFTSASQVRARHDEDPERITAGRYRLPDLTARGCVACYLDGPSRWCEICEGRSELITGTEPRKGGWQRVTTLVKAIGDARALDLWHQRLLVLGFVKRPDLYDLACATVATTPEAALREPLERIAGKVLAAVGADEGANIGTAFHGFTEAQDMGMMHYARRIWHGKLSNYSAGLAAQGLVVRPQLIERRIVVLKYGIAGTLDRILWDEINHRLVVGDLKSQKKFWTWLEISAQLAAYAMADAMWDRAKRCYVDMPPVSAEEAVVAWMPVTHPDADDSVDFFSVDLEKGRAALELCSRVDAMRSEAKSVHQTWGLLRPAPGLALVETYGRRLDEAETPAEGSAVWAEIVKAGLHETPELLEIAQEAALRMQGVP